MKHDYLFIYEGGALINTSIIQFGTKERRLVIYICNISIYFYRINIICVCIFRVNWFCMWVKDVKMSALRYIYKSDFMFIERTLNASNVYF